MTLSTRAASERGLLAVFCYSNYASGEMAPTSRTNTTFGGRLTMSRINVVKIAGFGRRSGQPSRSRFGKVKKPHAATGGSVNGIWKPSFRNDGLALAAITP